MLDRPLSEIPVRAFYLTHDVTSALTNGRNAVGAILGDNSAYALGGSGLRRLVNRLLGSDKNQQRLRWSRTQLQRRGAWIIIVARFIPGGRTATTYIAGTLDMPWKRRFLPADTAAAIAWARSTGAHKIALDVFPHNDAAIALYEKAGFLREGYHPRHLRRKNGELWDVISMGLLL